MNTAIRIFPVILTCAGILACAGVASAQDYQFVLSDESGNVGDTATLTVTFANDGESVEGYQFDVCHPTDLLDIGFGDVSLGTGLEDIDFSSHIVTIESDAFAVSAVLDSAENVLDPGDDLEFYLVTYEMLEEGFAELEFCESILEPSVTVDGDELVAEGNLGSINIDAVPDPPDPPDPLIPDPDYQLMITSADVLPEDGEVTLTVFLTIDGDAIQGYQWGVCHDDVFSLAEGDVVNGVDIEDIGTTFQTIDVLDDGWVTGHLFDVITGVTLGPGDDFEMHTMTYTFDDDAEGEVAVEFCDTLGIPAVGVGLIVGAAELLPVVEDGTVTIGVEAQFLRGDADGSGTTSALIDALYILVWGFTDGPEPPCDDAADADDNGTLSPIIDALFLLEFGFTLGDAPPDPGPDECGTDPTDDDDVTCETPPAVCD